MKKFFLIAGLMVAAMIAVAFGSCTMTGPTNQAADNTTVPATPVPTPTGARQNNSKEPVITTREAALANNVFTNEVYGYKVTVPKGYQVQVEETRNDSLPNGGWDRVIINNTQGQEFATIRTPAPEIGFELWTWTEARRSVSQIPGTGDYSYRYEVPGDKAMGMERALIAASWGFDLHDDGVAPTRDYDQRGLISAEVESLTSADARQVRDMIASLRLL